MNQLCYYLTRRREDKGVSAFTKNIRPKVYVMVQQELDSAYKYSAVHPFKNDTTRTSTSLFDIYISLILTVKTGTYFCSYPIILNVLMLIAHILHMFARANHAKLKKKNHFYCDIYWKFIFWRESVLKWVNKNEKPQ